MSIYVVLCGSFLNVQHMFYGVDSSLFVKHFRMYSAWGIMVKVYLTLRLC